MNRFRLACAVLVTFFMSSSAFAVVISTPLNYDTANLVGTADPGTASATIANEVDWANAILALGAGVTSGIYRTHNTDDYVGSVSALGAVKDNSGGTSVGAGFAYVMGKYDGKNAGYVLFYLGGEASTIPLLSEAIWTNTAGEGYALSHWTAFGTVTKVPEPETLLLLGIGLVALGTLRRRGSKAA